MILFKKVVGSTLKYIAKSLQIIKLYSYGFVIHNTVKVLIAKAHLNIKPIFSFSLFFKYFLDS